MKNIVTLLCVLGMSSQVALADTAGNKKASSMKMPTMTAEQRQKMADAHDKMAACLRSDKPLGDCREEMMKACKEGMGKDGCPMMGQRGMHQGHMMHSDESSSTPTQ